MAAVKTKLGRIACFCCGHPAWVKQNEGGTLTVACDECDINMIAKKGTGAQKLMREKLPSNSDEPSEKSPPGAAPGKVPDKVPDEQKKPPVAPPVAPKPPKPAPANPLEFFGIGKAVAA